MALRNIAGNERIVERLAESVRTGTVSHAYLFEGDSHADKFAVAKEFAKAVLCEENLRGDACDQCVNCRKMDHGNYEDFIEIGADGSSIKDEAILALQGELAKKPYAGSRHIVVIRDADTMTLRAQNRLLKTLEEPALGTVIMLLSENTENLVSTILSRCIVFRLHGQDSVAAEEVRERARLFAELAVERAPFYRMSAALGDIAQKREEAGAFLDSLERRFRDMALCAYDKRETLLYEPEDRTALKEQGRMLTPARLAAAVSAIEEARRDLARNINTGYALKNMILKL
ncbi:DNA polymerase III subunit [Bacilliculturomica massiliensis]|uniref:DNA polymerase III subunit n=1 Tax=Bacilliculturomica massiliensis TaxID=1917867 RepID=UPI001031789C|nr:hypothetical protein [Bacilliculturomica massiliensis]